MLDGLDEVPDETQRRQVSQWVDSQIRMFPENIWILSSRPFGYQNAQLKEARTTLGVLSFSLKQMNQFLNRWYLQNEILRQARKPDPGVKADAKRKADDLINRIQNYPPLAAMALNPLLLTMIATVHDNRGALPGSRVELYDEICDVLLVRRQEAKGLTETLELKAAQKQSVLQALALDLMMRERREFCLETGSDIISDALKSVAGNTVSPQTFLKHIQNVSGLLVEREANSYQFAHLSFQEYLAADQLKETQQEDCLVKHLENSWWHETIRLYAANSDTTAIVEAALDQPSVTSLMIAYDCLDESRSLSPEVRQRLDAIGSDNTNPAMAKLTAEVKLAQRLTRLLRIDEATQIDQSYVTQAEFKLFLNGTGKVTGTNQLSNPCSPLVGISLKQALQFCRWLNTWETIDLLSSDQESVGYSYYRLPTIAEAAQIKANEHEQLDCWTIGHKHLHPKGLRIVKAQIALQCRDIFEALAASDWKHADRATNLFLIGLSHQLPSTLLNENAIKTLPCRELAMLDRLWFHFSDGQFSLGIQANIWEAFAFSPLKQAQNFTAYVGWSKQQVKKNIAINFPPGHFPAVWFLDSSNRKKQNLQAMMQKFIDCGSDLGPPLSGFETVTIDPNIGFVQRTLHTAQYFLENLPQETSLQMVAIPGGTFTMGSPHDEEGHSDAEGPQHEVTVAPFWMSQYSITQAQWRAVATFPKINRELKIAPSKFRGKQRPVEQVSWEEAVEFCDRISRHTNRQYRLPTEAEWEYACRAGTTTSFHFGPTITKDLANFGQSLDHRTSDVGNYSPNAFGLFDMHGNVWEWCQDDWHDSYEGAPTDGHAWLNSDKSKVVRGGSWSDDPWYCRSATRINLTPGNRFNAIGFRVVCSAPRALS